MFEDRHEAGQVLAGQLQKYYRSCYVVAIPRGGIIAGYEVAKKLQVPLRVVVARKMGSIHNPELGIGAVGEKGVIILQQKLISELEISTDEISKIEHKERQEIQRRVDMYRKGKSLNIPKDRVVILVDDGLATGVTVMAAIMSLKKFSPKKIILAVPVCAAQTASFLRDRKLGVVCVLERNDLRAIGLYYKDFHQVEDDEVIRLLQDSEDFLHDEEMISGFR